MDHTRYFYYKATDFTRLQTWGILTASWGRVFRILHIFRPYGTVGYMILCSHVLFQHIFAAILKKLTTTMPKEHNIYGLICGLYRKRKLIEYALFNSNIPNSSASIEHVLAIFEYLPLICAFLLLFIFIFLLLYVIFIPRFSI